MLTIDPLELIQLIANTNDESDIYSLVKYMRGVNDFRDVQKVAQKHGFKLRPKRGTTPRKYTTKLKHYTGIPCGTSGVFELETEENKENVTCQKCLRLISNKTI